MAASLRLQPAGRLGFCQSCTKGKQPYWSSSIYRVYLKPVLENDLKIKEPVGWHTLRHSLGTLMKANGEDIKTIQETLRQPTSRSRWMCIRRAIRRSGEPLTAGWCVRSWGWKERAMKSSAGSPQVEILIEPFQTHVFLARNPQAVDLIGVPDGI